MDWNFCLGKSFKKNLRNKTAFIKNFPDNDKEKKQQLVMLTDIVDFGDTVFNEFVIGSDESVRNKFISAEIFIEERT